MRRDKQEEYPEDVQDVIDTLRDMERDFDISPQFLSQVTTRSKALLPRRRQFRTRWWHLAVAWERWQPLVRPAVVASVSAGLVFLLTYPVITKLRNENQRLQQALERTEKREQDTSLNLRKTLSLLIKKENILAEYNLDGGFYRKASEHYKNNAEREFNENKHIYYMKSFAASWMNCDFQDARENLDKIDENYIREPYHKALISLYRGSDKMIQGDYDHAITLYHEVTDINTESLNDIKSIAWFNIAVAYAQRYKSSKNINEVKNAKIALDKSVQAARAISNQSAKDRVRTIENSLKDFLHREYPSPNCDETYHITQDLTPFSRMRDFREWLNGKWKEI